MKKFKDENEVQSYIKEHSKTLIHNQQKLLKEVVGPVDNQMVEDYVYQKLLNPELMSQHQTIVPDSNIDIYEYLKDIQKSPIEKNLVILLDKNKIPVDFKITDIGDTSKVGDADRPYSNVMEFVLSNKKARYFIHAHNHPLTIGCFPSASDMAITFTESILGKIHQIELLDSCIISEFDFFSQAQYESQLEEKDCLLKQSIDYETLKTIKASNEYLYRFLSKIRD